MTEYYYGTKKVQAWEQQRTTAVDHDDPSKGNKTEDGYAIKYEDGYISWSPKDVFEKSYKPITAMSFGHALEAMKAGEKVSRKNWNGKNQFVALQVPDENSKMRKPYIYISPVDGELVPWFASQTDMLANDWFVVDKGNV